MSDGKISRHILEGIQENSDDDEIIAEFLRYLIFEEASHSGSWQWRKTYRQKIKQCALEWEGTDAN